MPVLGGQRSSPGCLLEWSVAPSHLPRSAYIRHQILMLIFAEVLGLYGT